MKRLLDVIFVVLLAAAPGAVVAAPRPPPLKPLKMSFRTVVPRARSQAPQTVDIRVDCNSPLLFTGRLELDWYVNKRLVHQYISPELTVTQGGQMYRLLVPQIVVRSEKTAINVAGRFVMERETIELDEQTGPSFPPAWKRSFVMVIVEPQEMLIRDSEREMARQRGASIERGLVDCLNLEQFNPYGNTLPQAQLDSPLDLLTYPAHLPPEDMPTTAAGYTSCDLLFLEGAGFEQLKGRQLAAMEQWVAAGGSVVVWPHGKLTADHVDFLNHLAGASAPGNGGSAPAEAPFALDEQRKFVISESFRPANSKFTKHVTGLGRSLIVHEPLDPQGDFSTPEWKAAVSFLWKVRDEQLHSITRGGNWQVNAGVAAVHPRATSRIFRPYAPHHDDLVRSIRDFLLPERIEGVPLAVVVVILGMYLLTIAPGDYFLLGRLNLRKYTWGLFVVVSAAFTWFTVLIAKSYMGHADYHTSLVFADIAEWGGSGGKPEVVRTNRFDMLFVAQQSMVEIPIRGELYTDLTDRAVMSETLLREWERRPFVFADNEEMDVSDAPATDLPVYVGVMPGQYSVHQQMRQWSPRINRRTMLGEGAAGVPAVKIDWNQLRPNDWGSPAGQRALLEAVEAQEPGAQVLLFHGDMMHDLRNNQAYSNGNEQRFQTNQSLAGLINAASARQAAGLFAVVSQIAPTGGEYLEDLTLLDSSDPRQWLLAVVVRRDNDWIVYRKLFRV
ncbi:MAG: hypothetical protein HY290_28290 [Planctomycetia bacterium]|nr:hypothetical protein [Planctomycetia bacterium]